MKNKISKRKTQPIWVNEFSEALLQGFYLKDKETPNDAIARAAEAFCYGDYELAQRVYEAAHQGWFMFASPILANAPKGKWKSKPSKKDWRSDINITDKHWEGTGKPSRAMPISCFAMEVPDTISGQMAANTELAALSVSGGGVGLHNSIRATTDKAPGPIPYMKTMDAMIGYYKQGVTRRGSTAYYMDVNHPDIIEHIKFRNPTGGDPARKADNRKQFHVAVNVTDEFRDAIYADDDFDLKCPHTGETKQTVKARELWEEILETRAITGEPYIFKKDTANRALPEAQKAKGLEIKGSNICIEITLPTNEERTFVCCLSSLNLEKYDEWKNSDLVADLTVFLDNVIQYFIDKAPEELSKSIFSAKQERALGIGTMGWHHYLQSKNIPWESRGVNSAAHLTHQIYKNIKNKAVEASLSLGATRGETPDMVGTGRRNSHLIAIAPNSNNAIIAGTSPSIEPISGVAYAHTTRAGTHLVQNPYFDNLLKTEIVERLNIPLSEREVWVKEQWELVLKEEGSVQHFNYLTDHEKNVFKTAFELDQHWVVELAETRAAYICQSQSLNLFFPAGVSAEYFNSVHLKGLDSPNLKSMYYCRMSRGVNIETVKDIERKALVDWDDPTDCLACEG